MLTGTEADSSQRRHARRSIPVVRGRPLLGVFSELLGDPLNFLVRTHERHGDVVQLSVPLAGMKIFAIRDPELARRVLLADEKTTRKHPMIAAKLRGVYGPGLFTESGPTWRAIRERQTPSLSRAEIDKLAPLIAGAVEHMLASWPEVEGNVELARAMSKVTMHITLEGLLGLPDGSSADTLYEAFEAMQDHVMGGASQLLRVYKWLPTSSNKRFRRAEAALREVVRRVVEHAATEPQPAPHLAAILAAKDHRTGQPLAAEHLHGEIVNTLFTGHDTTATTVAFALRMLAIHPQSLKNVEAELARVLGGRAPTIADARQLEALGAVIQETLRLYPPAWAQQRTSLVDLEYEGYRIPRGAFLTLSIWALHRHPQHWPDPEAFIPERFMKTDQPARHPFAHIPFGAGARACIGRNLAMIESVVILAMVLQRYELLAALGTPELRARFSLRPDAVEMRVRKRPQLLGQV